jgi:hypothetical protein
MVVSDICEHAEDHHCGCQKYKYIGSISYLVAQLATVEAVDILYCMLVSGCVV